MYTHPVISQRSPGWFFFLVKLTFLHSASPAPISAIQNVHSDHRTSQEIDSLDAALPFFIFESQIFIIWHLPCFALILERKNALSLPSLGKTTKAKQHRLQWSGQGGCSKTSSSRLQIMQDRKMPLKQLLPPNSRNTSMYWITQKPGFWEEKNTNSGWGIHWDTFLTWRIWPLLRRLEIKYCSLHTQAGASRGPVYDIPEECLWEASSKFILI